jgi:uncharacterized membrane protein
MATDVTNAPAGTNAFPAARANEASLSGLIGGIVEDAEKLIEQQFTLLKHDVRKDVQRAKDTAVLLGAGVGVLVAAGLLLLFMLVHLLFWLAGPQLPLWACFAIVGGVLGVIGGVVLYRGKQKLDKLNVVPEQSAEAMKENLQWQTNPR